MKIVLVRHGPTDWNATKRIQGRIDNPLSAPGVERVKKRQLPVVLRQMTWYTSPLRRARETAELMGIINPVVEPALIEMDWGEWEGEILKPLRKHLGDEMRQNEARGLDFRPPGGESPGQVQRRIEIWLKYLVSKNQDCGAISHKGIIRCVYALASGWDMRGESPVKFDWDGGHVFHLDDSGELTDSYESISFS
jgi:broad specificity phosphatase PhoE